MLLLSTSSGLTKLISDETQWEATEANMLLYLQHDSDELKQFLTDGALLCKRVHKIEQDQSLL